MAEKTCVICGGSEGEGEVLLQAPCRDHWVCVDDVGSFFQRATESESLFPPKCCEQMFILDDYEEHVPFDIAWQYRVKEQGEYAILAKFRVYCGDPKCTKFLHPSSHITDDAAGITYAICEDEACGKITCISCRLLLENGIASHVCKKDENEEAFKQEVTAKGYQLCSICNTTIELIEACNHITCECGHDFCYVCGKEWLGLHACPHYGPPKYDEDGYNQDGYHRDTGLNHDGLTRRQDLARRRGENPDEMDEDEDIREEDDPDWEVLQHLTADQRAAVNALMEDARDDALDQLRIELFETRGLMFGPGPEADERNEDQEEEGEEQIREANSLDELFDILHPMITRLPVLPIGLPNFPQAMRDALAQSDPQRIQTFLALMDPAYDPATHTLTVDFDRERIRFVAQEMVDRTAATGAEIPAMDDVERLLLAVLPHVIVRANDPQEAEDIVDGQAELHGEDSAPNEDILGGADLEILDDAPDAGTVHQDAAGGEEQGGEDNHDDLYAQPDETSLPAAPPNPHERRSVYDTTRRFMARAGRNHSPTPEAMEEDEEEMGDDHDDLYAHPDDPPSLAPNTPSERERTARDIHARLQAAAAMLLGRRDGSESADGDEAGPETPVEIMEDIQEVVEEAAGKIQGPPGGWPEVEEEMD